MSCATHWYFLALFYDVCQPSEGGFASFRIIISLYTTHMQSCAEMRVQAKAS